jgi:cyclopropane fatty-acyl-phospholipid synthase-like methyltransferase
MIGGVIPRYFVVAEATHELQNPTSAEKLLLLGRRLGLGAGSRVLDIASGRGGPALLLAGEYGCTWHGIEISPDFHAVAIERVAKAGLADRVTFELANAAEATHEPESYDAALCLGASFVYGSLADTVDALAPAVRPDGHVVVGERTGAGCRSQRTTRTGESRGRRSRARWSRSRRPGSRSSR